MDTARQRIMYGVLIVLVVLAAIAAVLLPYITDLHGNPAYQDRRALVSSKPVSVKNDAVALPSAPATVSVLDAQGKTVSLALAAKPVLFFYYDCAACQQTLATWPANTPYPILISSGFAPGTPISVARRLTNADLRAHHVPTTVTVYYRVGSVGFIPGFPTLVYRDAETGTPFGLSGLHSQAVWHAVMTKMQPAGSTAGL